MEESEIHEETEAQEMGELTRESSIPGRSESSEVPEVEHDLEAMEAG